MIPQPNALYFDKKANSYLRIFYIIPESKIYYAGIVSLDYEILEWPKDAQTFDYFKQISKNFELVLDDPMRIKDASTRREDIEKRDKIVSILKEVVDNNEPVIYFKTMRNRLIKTWLNQNSKSGGKPFIGKSTLYTYIDKYLSGGKTIDLFTPKFSNCGLKGQEKSVGKIKLGRPSLSNKSESDCIMDRETKNLVKIAYKKYIKSYGLKGSYEMMLLESFKNKKRKPTLSQYARWGKKLNDAVELSKEINGKIIHEKDLQTIDNTARQDVFGPGSEIMMDSTKDNTYTVSIKFQHKYLGRCTLYLACDVFSGLVVGFTLTPDNSSYLNAALTLYNVGINKTELFKELELDLKYEDWPCDFMPARILCDRGPEFVSYMSE
ncbi:MAG: hypothetical protein MUF43_10695, partial [Flavobacterium sp.]|nr:hypothetical protein [Flavobacterium sp.]